MTSAPATRARPWPATRRSGAARTGSPCRSRRPPTATSVAMPSTAAIASSFAARKAGRPTGWASTIAAVPRSSSPETLPIASAIAASAPSWPRFFWSCSSAIVAVGSGKAIGSWSPMATVEDLVEVPRGERGDDPDDEEQHRDDGQPPGPPRLQQLLPQQDAEAAHAAAPSVLAGQPEEDVLQGWSGAGHGDDGEVRRADDLQQLPRRRGRVRHGHGQQAVVHGRGRDPRPAPRSRAASASSAASWPGSASIRQTGSA